MDEENDLIELLKAGLVEEAKQKFTDRDEIVEKALKQYNIEDHEVMNRHDGLIKSSDGSAKDMIRRWCLPIANQQKIVQSSVDFLFGKPVKLIQESENTQKAFDLLTHLWKEMRMDTKNTEVAKYLFSETECAKLFVGYRDADASPTDLTKLNSVRCVVLAKSKKDRIKVRFNEFGGLESIGRGYDVKTKNGKMVEHFDVYLPNSIFFCRKDDNGSWIAEEKINLTGKINLSYYVRDHWDSYLVDNIIARREMLTSKRAENNDAMGDPILLLEGEVISLPDREETAKVVKMEPGGKASYLYPQMAVDMVKEEREDLKNIINYITDTPDFSTDQLSSLGQDSGKALVMRFFPAVLKAMRNRAQFIEMLDREVNILKAFMTKIIDTSSEMKSQCEKLKVSWEFSTPLPDNEADLIEMLSTATGGKATLSQEEAAHLNPLIKNGAENWKKIQAEGKDDSLTIEDSI